MANEFTTGRQSGDGPLWMRKPRRITITIPAITYTHLLERSNSQGRSISNLAAFLLEQAVDLQSIPDRPVLDQDSDHRRAA